MIVCPKCGKELADNSKFCDGCGAELAIAKFCPVCNNQISENSVFCTNCGNKLNEVSSKKSKKTKTKTKKNKKAVMIMVLVLVVLLTLSTISAVFFSKSSSYADPDAPEKIKAETDFIYYGKDKEIFVSDINEKEIHTQITSQMINQEVEKDYVLDYFYEIGDATFLTADESVLFFPDKISEADAGFNLYYRKLKDLNMPVEKIDSSLATYEVNSNGTIVTYEKRKGEDSCSLYQYSLETLTKEKIVDDVYNFYVSDDGNRIIYMDSDKNLYLKDADKDREKLASEVSYIEYVSEDFSVIYYTKENAFYKHVIGEDRVKIASDVSRVYEILETGEIFYSRTIENEIPFIDFINDDLKESDDNILLPEEPVYPDYQAYATREEYNLAVAEYEENYKNFEIAYEEYVEKIYRDEFREALAETTYTDEQYSLFYYNGAEEIKICDDGYFRDISKNKIFSYSTYSQPQRNSINFSEVLQKISEEDIGNFVELSIDDMSHVDETYLYINGESTLIDYENIRNFRLNDAGTAAYFLTDVSEETDHGELYSIGIVDSVPSEPELFDSEVYEYQMKFIDDEQFQYFKNAKNDHGDLYINKEKIDFDVYMYGIEHDKELDTVFYYVDYIDEAYLGTLKKFSNGEVVKIADDVFDFSVGENGKIYYLNDYSIKSAYGELYEWDNGVAAKIDSDVSVILDKNELKKSYDEKN